MLALNNDPAHHPVTDIYVNVKLYMKQTKLDQRKSQQYLHPWNNLLQNVVQTNSPQWRAQRPRRQYHQHEKRQWMMGKHAPTTPPLLHLMHSRNEVY